MLSQPILKLRELDGARLLQRARGESSDPVVVDAERGGNGPMLADSRLNRFPSLLNPLFYRH